MIKFVVLEGNRSTRTRDYARIHRASCGHAREPNHKTASTLCHGYFDTYYEALELGYIEPVVATLGNQTTRRLAHYATVTLTHTTRRWTSPNR